MSFERFSTNLKAASTRKETLEGREYRVVPMVMIVEGVLNGSNGPLLYPGDELSNLPGVWNHKPVVVYHPEMHGQCISACTPEVINNQKVGLILNTEFVPGKGTKPGKLKAEAWLEEDRLSLVDNRVLEAITNGTMLELSTGLFTENEDEEGTFNGKAYSAVARNYKPDHLAILPDQVGASSIADGAGFLRVNAEGRATLTVEGDKALKQRLAPLQGKFTGNALSHNNIRDSLYTFLRNDKAEKDRYDVWIEDVYDEFFVYADKGKLFKLDYAVTRNQVGISGEPTEVRRHMEYRTVVGDTFVGNFSEDGAIPAVNKEVDMTKKEIVDGLIANTQTHWEEGDREALMGMDDAVLGKLAPKVAANSTSATDAEKQAVADAAKQGAKELEAPPAANKVKLEDVFSPEQIQTLNRQATHYNKCKADVVAKILGFEANQFTEAELKSRDLDELEKLAAFIRPAATANSGFDPDQDELDAILFEGAAGFHQPTGNRGAVTEEPMDLPTMNFDAA
jgi:hypothetical protein